MKKFIRVTALALAVLMLAVLAGCAKAPASSAAPAGSEMPASSTESKTPEKDYKNTKFTVAWWGERRAAHGDHKTDRSV